MSTTTKTVEQTTTTPIASTGLNSLANNGLVLASALDMSVGQSNLDGNQRLSVQLSVQFGTAPTTGTGVSIWWLKSIDGGTTYEDGGTSVTPARAPDLVIPVRPVTTAQVITKQCDAPVGKVKPLIKNDGTGQAFSSSGISVIVLPSTDGQF